MHHRTLWMQVFGPSNPDACVIFGCKYRRCENDGSEGWIGSWGQARVIIADGDACCAGL